MVNEFLARADIPGSTSQRRCFLFLCTFFFSFDLCFLTRYPFGLFSFILTADPADYALGSIYILSSSEFYFGKGISRAHDLRTGQAYGQKKIYAVKICSSSETAEFFSMSDDIMTNNTQYTTNRTNLLPTPTRPTGEI